MNYQLMLIYLTKIFQLRLFFASNDRKTENDEMERMRKEGFVPNLKASFRTD